MNQICFLAKVESWLNSLLDTMRITVRKTLQESVVSYEDKPRDQWLFDYPAQIALTGSQIWWTTEVIYYCFEVYASRETRCCPGKLSKD